MKEQEIGQWVLDLCRQFQEAAGIPGRSGVGASAEEELSPAISIALFRIIQETLGNIYKHAEATHATLSLDFGPSGPRLVIEDDGRGFDVDARPARAIQQGHGLANLEERVPELGPTLELESAPGAGTPLDAGSPSRP